MNIRRMLLSLGLLCLLLTPLSAVAEDPGQRCIILVQPDPGLLSRQAAALHQLIDLLPDDYQLGFGTALGASVLAPAPLTLARRADLHAAVQAAATADQPAEPLWQQLVGQAISLFPDTMFATDNCLLVISSSGESPGDSSSAAYALANSRVQTVVLTEQSDGRTHPLAATSGGQQLAIAGDLLSIAAQRLGLGSEAMTQTAMGQDARVHTFSLDDAMSGFVLMVERALPEEVSLVSPSGQTLQLGAGLTYCLATSEYACLHVYREQAASVSWSGDWQVTIPTQAAVSLFVDDPADLDVAVTIQSSGRLVSASIWRAGERLDQASLGDGQVKLCDLNGAELSRLNDLGLAGDQTAGDGVFSICLPDFVHPLAGTAILEVQGYAYRSAFLDLPEAAAPVTSHNRLPQLSLPIAVGALFVGAVGLAWTATSPTPASWRLEHQSPSGYRRRQVCRARAISAGSGAACALRLSAFAGQHHLRFVTDSSLGLTLEVLQAEPVTLVNGERVYLRQELHHGDVVQVGLDLIEVERMERLRNGRRPRPGRDLAADGK